jgi:iron complex transport system ATP-binding protein
LAGGYGAEVVVRGVDLCLERGETTALLGRNGCGKSTLLRLLAGALPPKGGAVLLEGKPLEGWPRRARAQRLAVVPQELHVPFAFSVREVVELGRAPYAQTLQGLHAKDRRAVDEALAATDLLELADRPYQQLSGGEQQRVALALALAQEPLVLLLDEPTVHLDIAHQMAVLALARRLCAAQGLAVLAAMHDINLSCLYFDRLLVMAAGGILASGPPGAVLSPALVEQAFGARVAVARHPLLDVPQVSLLP